MRRREKGASLIEVALVLPILLSLAIGLAEVGFLVIDYVTVTNAARSGARTGATLADTAGTDQAILNVVEEDLCNLSFGSAVVVRIFKANADGSMSSSQNNYSSSGSLACNDSTTHAFTCSALEGGCNWPDTSRSNSPPNNFDRIGVRIEFTHDWVTNFFPFGNPDYIESAVMQLEPDTGVGVGT